MITEECRAGSMQTRHSANGRVPIAVSALSGSCRWMAVRLSDGGVLIVSTKERLSLADAQV